MYLCNKSRVVYTQHKRQDRSGLLRIGALKLANVIVCWYISAISEDGYTRGRRTHNTSSSNVDTFILFLQAVYETPSRRRRAVSEYCETPEPGVAYFANTSSKGTIRNLQMFTRYEIVLKSFNVAGESPPSEAISARTAEGGKLDAQCKHQPHSGQQTVKVWNLPSCRKNKVLDDEGTFRSLFSLTRSQESIPP